MASKRKTMCVFLSNEPPNSDDNLSLGRKTALSLVGAPKTKVRIYRGSRIALNVYELIVLKIIQKIVEHQILNGF